MNLYVRLCGSHIALLVYIFDVTRSNENIFSGLGLLANSREATSGNNHPRGFAEVCQYFSTI